MNFISHLSLKSMKVTFSEEYKLELSSEGDMENAVFYASCLRDTGDKLESWVYFLIQMDFILPKP